MAGIVGIIIDVFAGADVAPGLISEAKRVFELVICVLILLIAVGITLCKARIVIGGSLVASSRTPPLSDHWNRFPSCPQSQRPTEEEE